MRPWWIRLCRYALPHWRGTAVLGSLAFAGVGMDVLKPWPMMLLVDGVFVSLLLKRDDDGSRQTIAMMGSYQIEDGAFTYGYDDGSYLIQRPDGAVDAPRVPFGERRRFDAIRDGSIIRLVWNDGAAEFRLGGMMADYLEHGVVQRRWERVAKDC